MKTEPWEKTAINLIDCIEDEEFPGMRIITDYILILLRDLDTPIDTVKSIERFFEKQYEKMPHREAYPQSKFKKEQRN